MKKSLNEDIFKIKKYVEMKKSLNRRHIQKLHDDIFNLNNSLEWRKL